MLNNTIKRYRIEGMTCQACATRLEKVLQKKPNVAQASVNFAGEEAQISLTEPVADAIVLDWVRLAGFEAKLSEGVPNLQRPKIAWQVWAALALALPFLFEMVAMMRGHMFLPAWLQLILASVVQWGIALPFYRSAWAALRGKVANMDVLVSLATLTIYSYSAAVVLLGKHPPLPIYFEAGVMVIAFVSIGKAIEARFKREGLDGMRALYSLTPRVVLRWQAERWQEVALSEVVVGDRLLLRQGDSVAADGALIEGHVWCDESHLTGEAVAVEKSVGDILLAGSRVVEGSGEYQANALGKATFLGDMMQALANAQNSKAPIARLADKFAAVFVPVVVAIAGLTFILTWWVSGEAVKAMLHAVAVLVIACPCAMGLATPAAIMVGLGEAVQRGVWFRDAAALEAAVEVSVVALDKTGTLTVGQPHVAGYVAFDERYSEYEALRLAATVEQYANHPLAQALVAAFEQQEKGGLWPTQSGKGVAGEGAIAEIDGIGEVRVGKPSFVGVVMLPDESLWQLASVVVIGINGKAIGAFALMDSLKSESQQAVTQLRESGVAVQIMSGDRQEAVDYVAQQLGLTQAFGGLLPRDKAERIRALQAQGYRVAMVGDGVNDAPALAQADVSFAMKGGADVAEHSATATLMRASILQVAEAFTIAKATIKLIKQNLFFAFFYNAIGIPLAAFGVLNPVFAGAAMALSSLSVIGNAIRLKWRLQRDRVPQTA